MTVPKRMTPIRNNATNASAAVISLWSDNGSRVTGGEADDAQLMERICNGERAAFALLVKRHADRFYRVAYRFTANRAESEDTVQEAFMKLWEKPHSWQSARNAAFTTWFHRIVINLCIDRYKKKSPMLIEDDSWVMDDRENHEEILARREREDRLEKEIAILPARQRMALNLCFYEGMSNQEAADVMGVHLKALQSLLMRAKTTLKERLKDYDHG